MSKYSAIDTLIGIVDGDTLVPGMGLRMPEGISRTIYYNPSTKTFTPDHSSLSTHVLIYPHVYSSATGKYLVPDSGTSVWYLGSIGTTTAMNEPGSSNVGAAWQSRFRMTTVTDSTNTYPALEIIGNPVDPTNLCDLVIYLQAKFNGIPCTCHVEFPVRESVGDIFEVVISPSSMDGTHNSIPGDTVIDNDTEFLFLRAQLMNNGVNVTAGATYTWGKITSSGFTPVAHQSGVSEISDSGKLLTLYDAAVEGTEEYCCQVSYNGNVYRGTIQVSDTHDPFYISLGRSQSSNLVKEGQTVTYTPSVVKRQGSVVQSGWSFSYVTHNSEGVVVKSGSGTTYSITYDELKTNGELTTIITATNS